MYDRITISGNDANAHGNPGLSLGLCGFARGVHHGVCLVAFLILTQQVKALEFQFTSQRQSPNVRVGRDIIFKGSGTVYIRQPGSSTWSPMALSASGQTVADFKYIPAVGFWGGGVSSVKAFNTTQLNTPDNQPSNTATVTYEYSRSGGSSPSQGTVSANQPVVALTHTRTAGDTGQLEFQYEIDPVTIDFGDGGTPPIVIDPAAPPVEANPLLGLEGTEVTIPLINDGDGPLVLEVGGKTYTFPPDPVSGVSDVTFTIPPNWDGTVKVNGKPVAIAPKLVYSGNPTGPLTANPYSPNLPPGMTPWVPTLPPGMTPGPLPLPPGVTVGTSLTPPPGVTITTGPAIGEYIKVQVTQNGVTTNHIVDTKNSSGTPGTQTGGSTTGTGGTKSSGSTGGATDPTGEIGKGGEIAGYGNGFGDGTGKDAPSKGITDKAAQARNDLKQLLSGMHPIAPGGSIPKVSTYSIAWNFGKFGVVNRTINFDEAPWTIIRGATLVVIIMVVGNAFFKRVTI